MAEDFINPEYLQKDKNRPNKSRSPPIKRNPTHGNHKIKLNRKFGLKQHDKEKCTFCDEERKRGVKDSDFILQGVCPLPTALKKGQSTENLDYIHVSPLHRCWHHLKACHALLESEWPSNGNFRYEKTYI